jgi:hypothetical protein
MSRIRIAKLTRSKWEKAYGKAPLTAQTFSDSDRRRLPIEATEIINELSGKKEADEESAWELESSPTPDAVGIRHLRSLFRVIYEEYLRFI